jgi:hypothetical protein
MSGQTRFEVVDGESGAVVADQLHHHDALDRAAALELCKQTELAQHIRSISPQARAHDPDQIYHQPDPTVPPETPPRRRRA